MDARAVALTSRETAIASAQAAVAARDVAEKNAKEAAASRPLSADELVGMRAVGVTPEYVAQMREHGGSMDPDDIIAAKATGVDPAYIGRMRSIIPDADLDELIGARKIGICETPTYSEVECPAMPERSTKPGSRSPSRFNQN